MSILNGRHGSVGAASVHRSISVAVEEKSGDKDVCRFVSWRETSAAHDNVVKEQYDHTNYKSITRSNRFIFVPFCLLCQGVRAEGVAIRYRAAVSPVVSFLMERDINIIQMPCPEIYGEGLGRRAAKKDHYDTPQFRDRCRALALELKSLIQRLRDGNGQVVGILGIENSPTCGINYVFRTGRGRVREAGVFVEELREVLGKELERKFVGVKVFSTERTIAEINALLADPIDSAGREGAEQVS